MQAGATISVRVRGEDQGTWHLGHGALIGRLATAALQLDDVRVSGGAQPTCSTPPQRRTYPVTTNAATTAAERCHRRLRRCSLLRVQHRFHMLAGALTPPTANGDDYDNWRNANDRSLS